MFLQFVSGIGIGLEFVSFVVDRSDGSSTWSIFNKVKKDSKNEEVVIVIMNPTDLDKIVRIQGTSQAADVKITAHTVVTLQSDAEIYY
jgi:hypothetical protein